MLVLRCVAVKGDRRSLFLLSRAITLLQQIQIQEKLGHAEHLPPKLPNLGIVKSPGGLAKEFFEFVYFIKPRETRIGFSGRYVLLHTASIWP